MVTALKAATLRKKDLAKADKLAINNAVRSNMISEIEELEHRAHGLGCSVTARALNQAKNALGWEMAGDILTAGKASRGEWPSRRRRS